MGVVALGDDLHQLERAVETLLAIRERIGVRRVDRQIPFLGLHLQVLPGRKAGTKAGSRIKSEGSTSRISWL